jgi:uncharacterized membrane protein
MESPMDLVDRVGRARIWVGTLVALVVGVTAAAAAFPRAVYDGILWRYYWGPVVADAKGAVCVERTTGTTTVHDTVVACQQASGIIATPGYTTVSTATYAAVLLFMLIGVFLLLDRLEVGKRLSLFYALVPFVVFGGALRTVEDANGAILARTGEFAIPFPETALIISPFIYGTVFVLALGALLLGIGLERRGVVDRYEIPVGVVGALLAVGTLGLLGWLAATNSAIDTYPIVPTAVVGGATLVAALFWIVTERRWPAVNASTGLAGPVVVWGHTVDGIANVIAIDWATRIGLPGEYGAKHVVNRLIIDVTSAVQPAWLSEAIGTGWPFLFVKIAVAGAIVWAFDERTVTETPRFAVLLLVAVLAVGLGPGTRNALRATLGI